MTIRVPALFRLLLPLAAVFLWIGTAAEASAAASIEDLRIEIRDNRVMASFQLAGALDEDFERRVASGLPTDLVYRLRLERDRRSWFDQSVAGSVLQVIAMYNAVTHEYLVNFKQDGKLIESRVVRDLETLRRTMTELKDMPVFDIGGRDPQERLQLRVRAELGTRMWLAFIPRTLATDWARTEHFRIADLAS